MAGKLAVALAWELGWEPLYLSLQGCWSFLIRAWKLASKHKDFKTQEVRAPSNSLYTAGEHSAVNCQARFMPDFYYLSFEI